MSDLIEAEGLIKCFGTVKALDGLDLGVAKGQIHGFLGPNGAGKSTTIRVLLGMYRTDGGRARVLGMDPAREASAINRRLAYVPGSVSLWPSLTGGQVLDTLAGLRGSRDHAREEELTERFDLDPTKKVRTYSKGNAQKVALVAALSAPVDLLVLDEPTSGLDPLMERVFTDVVREAAEGGATVLLSSHILAEVQDLCSHVTIIKEGRTVESGDLSRLRSLAETAIRIGVGESDSRRPRLVEALAGLGAPVRPTGTRVETRVPSSLVPEVLGVVAELGADDVQVEPASLEDLFMSHYSGDEGARS
ncbi:ABC transporter ATP-binding protein [Pauljensenia hongkongensis]|uniref:ABC transporter n=1 Tax=Pauljensenia hongkongensis TaxID=178339 RepID=A0A1D8B2A4_9ACTO|nr:ABC transporter ATP-binding protein [Pauljensenia hongkongensis]AOS47262.1 ABC transporter [Pauljensenia hongkongensis]EFW10007.1 efflux ABC superfamily ATP binding cassette transporter, ABC protein [Actinomyces sp. oral taxon 178 str. F0338]